MSEREEGLVDPGRLGRLTPTTVWDWPTNWPQTPERRCSAAEHVAYDITGEAEPMCSSALVWYWTVLPGAWQMQLWGKVLDKSGYWLCPNVWASHKLACCGVLPEHNPDGRDARVAAERMWEGALAERAERIASRPESVDPETARCARCGGGWALFLGRWIHECPLESSGARSAAPSRRPSVGSTGLDGGAWGPGDAPGDSASVRTGSSRVVPDLADEDAIVTGDSPPLPAEMTWDEIVQGRR